ncbi:MAG: single-stranded DNA-binding protein [Eubacteriales bacterium]|nr:single-stranded DNA-binding protein [Eubacteriales bacterium]
MSTEILTNNYVNLLGEVEDAPTFSHCVYNESFYKFPLKVHRLSEACDTIIITISEHLLNNADIICGNKIYVEGSYRSYNNFSGTGNKLMLTVFVKLIENVIDEELYPRPNYIYLDGYICKAPSFRVTPFGREITDILIAVNRTYNKSDYIPCIAWGHNSRYASTLDIGTNIIIEGRVQSRNYQKVFDDEVITKTAYEVSVTTIKSVS